MGKSKRMIGYAAIVLTPSLSGCGIQTNSDVYKRIESQTKALQEGNSFSGGFDGLIERLDYYSRYVPPLSFVIFLLCLAIGGVILGFAREDVGMKKRGIGFIVFGAAAVFFGILISAMADIFL